MNKATIEYLISIAEYEERVFVYSEKIKFRDSLLDIISNHSTTLTDGELRDAQKLLDYIQKEIMSNQLLSKHI